MYVLRTKSKNFKTWIVFISRKDLLYLFFNLNILFVLAKFFDLLLSNGPDCSVQQMNYVCFLFSMIEMALKADPSNSELLQLKTDLETLIQLTKDDIDTQKESEASLIKT